MKLFLSIISIIFSISVFSIDIYEAIAIVESNKNTLAIGDRGFAIGMYQIHKIYVDDVNRILKRNTYTYVDRINPVKSLEMVKIYTQHYSKIYCTRYKCPPSDEIIARIHNGGPNGMFKKSTIKYWNKVKEVLEYANQKM